MASVVWSKDVHTMGESKRTQKTSISSTFILVAHLPKEILSKVFQYVSGKDLISLVGTCTDFKSLIEETPLLIEKIAFKVASLNNVCFYEEGTRVLPLLSRHINCLSICDLKIKAESGLRLLMGRYNWKHLKMRNCQFETADSMSRFLSAIAKSLEIIDFDQVSFVGTDRIISVGFPKLQKLTTTHLQINFVSATLKELELKCVYRNPGINPMMTNNIEVLTLTYSDINFFFKREDSYEHAPSQIKKLVIRDNGHRNHISILKRRSFQSFLKLQTNIEEICIDTFGRYKGTFARILSTIFREMPSVRKLEVKNRHMIDDLSSFDLGKSQTITKLCLDIPENKNSVNFFRKIIESCPNTKNLSIDTFDQHILQKCFKHMKNLETIDAKVILIERGVSSVDKLPNLKHLTFSRIKHKNFTELSYMPLMTQQNFALKMLRGPTNSLFF